MNVYVYEGASEEFVRGCVDAARDYGGIIVNDPAKAKVAIAPLLTRRLDTDEWKLPELGTLIHHPSALPYRRGPDAIRRTIAAGERVSASTWFWCDNNLDTGPICEQEVVVLHPDESPGRAYHTRFVPAAIRALRRAMWSCAWGIPRRTPQDNSLATYETFLGK